MPVIRSTFSTEEFHCSMGQTLFDALVAAGFPFPGSCGGNGTCGKCLVRVDGKLSAPGERERALLGEDKLREGFRLACRTRLQGDAVLLSLPTCTTAFSPVAFSEQATGEIGAGIRQYRVAKRSFDFTRSHNSPSDLDAFLRACGTHEVFPVPGALGMAKQLVSLLGGANQQSLPLTACTLDGMVVHVSQGVSPGQEDLLLAFDIGTTTLSGALLHVSGKTVARARSLNPQGVHGADVISRIAFCKESGGLQTLQAEIREALALLGRFLLEKGNFPASSVRAVALAGNSCMHHLFWGISPERLGAKPFSPALTQCILASATESGFPFLEGDIPLFFLPSVAGFVGSDALASSLWCNLDRVTSPTLLVDLGTNGEILLAAKGKTWCCSTAAGPALEGMGLACGMPAIPGALSGVDRGESDQMVFSTVAGEPLRGICGSGLISLVANLLERGEILPSGAFSPNAGVEGKGRNRSWVLQRQPRVFLSQEDVRQFQLAKAAIRTGIDLLLEKAGVDPGELDQLFLAGSFGSELDVPAAMATGLLPRLSPSRVHVTASASCNGVALFLVDAYSPKRVENMKAKMQHVALQHDPSFQDRFLRCLSLEGGTV